MMLAYGRAYIVKADLSDSAFQAKRHLDSALEMLSRNDFDQALEESAKAKAEVEKIKLNLQSWGQNSQYLQLIDYRSDIVGTETLLSSIDQVLAIATSAKALIESLSTEMGGQAIADAKNIDFTVDIATLDAHLGDYSDQIALISQSLMRRKASSAIVSQADQAKILSSFTTLRESIQNIRSTVIPLLSWFLAAGEERDKKIMLIFQNNAEIRGSGGFIGSYAIVNTHNSAITRIDFQTNIYKLDNAVKDTLNIEAPPEYSILSGGKMFLRDANYAVDGPESFSQVLKMYKLESGQELDAVVALDTSLITSLLQVVGPISMPQYGLTIDQNNFLTEVQAEVEQNYFLREGGKVENEPKKILADMLPILLSQILDKTKDVTARPKIFEVMAKSISGKHLLFYSNNLQIQQKIEQMNMAGKVATGDFDYFYSHSTNIGGGKSSLNVAEELWDTIEIGPDGAVAHNVKIKREHEGDGVWPDGININLMRILMPKDSQLGNFRPLAGNTWPHMDKKYANRPDHYSGEEAGRTKLSFWMNSKPHDFTEVEFSYTTSYRVENDSPEKIYKLFLQKQPGTKSADYHLTVKYPESWNYIKNYIHTDLKFDVELDRDKMLELKFE